jgi:enoyl-CoA hydratase/carnithine racemase
MNSLGGTLLGDVVEAFIEGATNDAVRAFVVTGRGGAWCAGRPAGHGRGGGAAAEPAGDGAGRHGAVGRAVLAIYNCNKPTIAAVNGVAVGGGFGLCTAFDVRVASEQARFGTIFIKRALAPDCGLSWFLPRLVGPEAAADLFYTGRIVDAQEALRLGIVSRVVPHEALMDEAMKLANEYARQAPSALTLTRRALQRSAVLTLEQQLEFEWTNQRTRLASPEFQEALSAFREKREPNFS